MSSVDSRDNISGSVDMAYVSVDVCLNIVFNFGKMSADWGGYESYLNAIDALQYNDIINTSDSFLTGVGATYQVLDNPKLGFQVLNASTKNFEEQYEDIIPLGIEKLSDI